MQQTRSRVPLLESSSVDDKHAFQSFIENLKIPKPSELILINPMMVPEEIFDQSVARNKGYYAYPPTGLLYIAAVAKEVDPNLEVRIIDLNYELMRRGQLDDFKYEFWEDVLKEAIESCKAPHIGMTCMFGATKPVFVNLNSWIKENFPDVPLYVGGVQATYDSRELLESGICDIVFRKESELQFKAFLERCVDPSSEAVPHGSAFRVGGMVYELGEPEPNVPPEWDIRPFYSLIDVENYHKVGSLAAFSRYNGPDKSFATVLSNRGCRARCTFCTVRNFNGFGVRQRSIDSVVEEIKFLVREKGINQIDWLDDDLLWNPERTVEMFKRIATEVPELEWICNNGLIAAAVTEDIMYWMVESGLKAFKIGIESGNDKMLHKIKKPTTKPKLRASRELFAKYPQVFVSANFIIGFPNETFGEMLDTYNFANELHWDWSSFYICQPLKGTEMFSAFMDLGDDRCEDEGYGKVHNPGAAAPRGEFGYRFEDTSHIKTGRDVFRLPLDTVPDNDQLKEIWFTFNLVANFLQNPNFDSCGRPEKIVDWLESIAHAYPYDASMAAALAKGYRLMGQPDKGLTSQKTFDTIVEQSNYWQRRIKEFPELLELASHYH